MASETPTAPSMPFPVAVSVSPAPTDVELAVIVAAFGELWPAPPSADTAPPAPSRWRFSGRWWADDPGQRVPGRAW